MSGNFNYLLQEKQLNSINLTSYSQSFWVTSQQVLLLTSLARRQYAHSCVCFRLVIAGFLVPWFSQIGHLFIIFLVPFNVGFKTMTINLENATFWMNEVYSSKRISLLNDIRSSP